MTALPRWARIAIVVLADADLLVFARATPLTLMVLGVGTILIFLGLIYEYKPASFLGLLISSAGAAASIEITTLTEISTVLTAIVGLLVPVSLLIWLTLSVEEGEGGASITKKPVLIAASYSLLCVWSVPVTTLVLGLFVPTLSMSISAMTEAAIMLMAVIVGAVILTRKGPIAKAQEAETTSE